MIKQLIFIAMLIQALSASDVIELKDSNFDSKIGQHDVALVEFYAPWCGHCKRLAPEYEKAATELKNNDPPVALVKVDCTVETKVCGKYGVNGYPTLKIFKSGEMASDYNGPRESDGIVKYMRTKAGPTAKELVTLADAEKFLAHNDHSIVAFSASGSTLLTEFKKVADQLAENYRFAYSSSPEVLAKYSHDEKVVIYQPPRLQVKLESAENVYSGDATANKIKSFIQNEIHGIVGHRTLGNAQDFKSPLVVVNFNVDYTRDAKGSNYVRNRVIKVAQKLKAEGIKVNFAISNSDEFKQELGEYGIEQTDDKIVIARGQNGEKFKFQGSYSVENLEQFARDLAAGTLEAYMKSENIPEPSDDAVVTVVGKNFNDVVNDESKDVLIEFYAPWCGHCKTLAPKYEELAKALKGEDSLVIAKIDATANDIPTTYDVKGFPTIYFAPKNSKQNPRRYEGGREVEDFVKYLAKESTEPLNGYDRSGKKLKKTEL